MPFGVFVIVGVNVIVLVGVKVAVDVGVFVGVYVRVGGGPYKVLKFIFKRTRVAKAVEGYFFQSFNYVDIALWISPLLSYAKPKV